VLVAAAAVALVLNALLVVDALTVGLLVPRAEARAPVAARAGADARGERPGPARNAAADADAGVVPGEAGAAEAEAAYRALVAELMRQKQALDRRAAALAEREQRVAGAEQALQVRGGAPEPPSGFERLVRAYEAMDPDNAAAALASLYGKERQAVIEILLGMKPRPAAAVLDALAAHAPSVAAELSQAAWQRERGQRP
jgi:flagellar motility protein MotE (MotC chaperone)